MASSMRFMSGDSGSDLAKKFYSNLETDVKVEKNIEALKYDEEWIDKIEYAIPYLNKIFENPKKFIIGEDEILNIEKTRKVTGNYETDSRICIYLRRFRCNQERICRV